MKENNIGEPANQATASEGVDAARTAKKRTVSSRNDQAKRVQRDNQNLGNVKPKMVRNEKGMADVAPVKAVVEPKKRQRKGCKLKMCSKCCLPVKEPDELPVPKKESLMTPASKLAIEHKKTDKMYLQNKDNISLLSSISEYKKTDKTYLQNKDTISLSSSVSDIAKDQEGLSADQIQKVLPPRKPRIYIAHDDTISLASNFMDDSIGAALQEKHTKDLYTGRDHISLSSAVFGNNNDPVNTLALLAYSDKIVKQKMHSSKKDSISLSSSIISDKQMAPVAIMESPAIVSSIKFETEVPVKQPMTTCTSAEHNLELAADQGVTETPTIVILSEATQVIVKVPSKESLMSIKQMEESSLTEQVMARHNTFGDKHPKIPMQIQVTGCLPSSESCVSIKALACSSTEKLVKCNSQTDSTQMILVLPELPLLSVDGKSVANEFGEPVVQAKSSNYVIASTLTASVIQVNVLQAEADGKETLPRLLSAETQIVIYAQLLEPETRPNLTETATDICAKVTINAVSKCIVDETPMYNADTSTVLDEVVCSIVDEILKNIMQSLRSQITAVPLAKRVVAEVPKPDAISVTAKKIVKDVQKKDYALPTHFAQQTVSSTSSINSEIEGCIVANAMITGVQSNKNLHSQPRTESLEDGKLTNSIISIDHLNIPERHQIKPDGHIKRTLDMPEKDVSASHITDKQMAPTKSLVIASNLKCETEASAKLSMHSPVQDLELSPADQEVKETLTTVNVPEATQFRVLPSTKENVVSVREMEESKPTEKVVDKSTAVGEIAKELSACIVLPMVDRIIEATPKMDPNIEMLHLSSMRKSASNTSNITSEFEDFIVANTLTHIVQSVENLYSLDPKLVLLEDGALTNRIISIDNLDIPERHQIKPVGRYKGTLGMSQNDGSHLHTDKQTSTVAITDSQINASNLKSKTAESAKRPVHPLPAQNFHLLSTDQEVKETQTAHIVPEANQFMVLTATKENVASIEQMEESTTTKKVVDTSATFSEVKETHTSVILSEANEFHVKTPTKENVASIEQLEESTTTKKVVDTSTAVREVKETHTSVILSESNEFHVKTPTKENVASIEQLEESTTTKKVVDTSTAVKEVKETHTSVILSEANEFHVKTPTKENVASIEQLEESTTTKKVVDTSTAVKEVKETHTSVILSEANEFHVKTPTKENVASIEQLEESTTTKKVVDTSTAVKEVKETHTSVILSEANEFHVKTPTKENVASIEQLEESTTTKKVVDTSTAVKEITHELPTCLDTSAANKIAADVLKKDNTPFPDRKSDIKVSGINGADNTNAEFEGFVVSSALTHVVHSIENHVVEMQRETVGDSALTNNILSADNLDIPEKHVIKPIGTIVIPDMPKTVSGSHSSTTRELKETQTTAIVPGESHFRVLTSTKENVVSIEQIEDSKPTEKVDTQTAVSEISKELPCLDAPTAKKIVVEVQKSDNNLAKLPTHSVRKTVSSTSSITSDVQGCVVAEALCRIVQSVENLCFLEQDMEPFRASISTNNIISVDNLDIPERHRIKPVGRNRMTLGMPRHDACSSHSSTTSVIAEITVADSLIHNVTLEGQLMEQHNNNYTADRRPESPRLARGKHNNYTTDKKLESPRSAREHYNNYTTDGISETPRPETPRRARSVKELMATHDIISAIDGNDGMPPVDL